MKIIINHEKYGPIVYKENFFTGKITLTIDEELLVQVDDTHFRYTKTKTSEEVSLKGNLLTGITLQIRRDTIQLIEKPTWYVLTISAISLLFILIIGSFDLTEPVFPVMGHLGGALVGSACMLANIYVTSREKDKTDKVLYSLCFFVGAIIACHLLAVIYNAVMAAI